MMRFPMVRPRQSSPSFHRFATSSLQHDRIAAWARAAAAVRVAEPTDRLLTLVSRSHPLRLCVERCIRETYDRMFGARKLMFPSTLLALLDENERPICAAGLRTADDGFFSEIYLDAPIEQVLSRYSATAVCRDVVFEVSTLVSLSADAAPHFIRRIASLGNNAGFAWSFFTATERLRKLLGQLGILTIELAAADPSRIARRDHWGRYYEHSPKVCAVHQQWLGDADAHPARGARGA
jgi:Thermostable hemolysin